MYNNTQQSNIILFLMFSTAGNPTAVADFHHSPCLYLRTIVLYLVQNNTPGLDTLGGGTRLRMVFTVVPRRRIRLLHTSLSAGMFVAQRVTRTIRRRHCRVHVNCCMLVISHSHGIRSARPLSGKYVI